MAEAVFISGMLPGRIPGERSCILSSGSFPAPSLSFPVTSGRICRILHVLHILCTRLSSLSVHPPCPQDPQAFMTGIQHVRSRIGRGGLPSFPCHLSGRERRLPCHSRPFRSVLSPDSQLRPAEKPPLPQGRSQIGPCRCLRRQALCYNSGAPGASRLRTVRVRQGMALGDLAPTGPDSMIVKRSE